VPFVELYSLYKDSLPPKIAKLDPRLFCKALFKAIGMNNNDFRFGSSKIFFRPGKFAEFDSVMRTDDKAHLMALIDKVAHWLVCAKWKKAIYGAWEVIKLRNKIQYRMEARVKIQKTIRMFLAIRRFRPMYRGLAKVSSIRSAIENCRAIVAFMKGGKKDSFNKEIDGLVKQMTELETKIKNGKLVRADQMDAGHATLLKAVEATAAGLQNKRKEMEECFDDGDITCNGPSDCRAFVECFVAIIASRHSSRRASWAGLPRARASHCMCAPDGIGGGSHCLRATSAATTAAMSRSRALRASRSCAAC